MGFFDDIKDAIFGGPAKAGEPKAGEARPTAAPAAPPPKPAASPTAAQASPQATVKPAPAPTAAPAPAPAPAPASMTAAAPGAAVDVGAVLDAAAKASGQTLNWRHSIVDLLKALGIDSSLTARKALAAELAYPGDTSDSAAMNIWLHKQVIQKLTDNGGKVPADLLD